MQLKIPLCPMDFVTLKPTRSVWVEIKANDGFNYFIGTFYFPPLSDQTIFLEPFKSIRKKIDFDKFRVQIYGDLNVRRVEWSL